MSGQTFHAIDIKNVEIIEFMEEAQHEKRKTEPENTDPQSKTALFQRSDRARAVLRRLHTRFAAGDDPLTAINNLSTFVFAAIKAIGVILLGWGVVQIGMSLQSHDPSQRSTRFLTFFGGLMIAFAKEILDLILK